jgi:hypothetical protein
MTESWEERFRRIRDHYIAKGTSPQEAAEWAREDADDGEMV